MVGTKSATALNVDIAPLSLLKNRDSGHIPALDGVRGLAILVVMACHFTIIEMGDANHKGILIDRIYGSAGRFGWVGVDLFFVLSGFLITGILLSSKSEPHYFRNFYARRILRIFPLYYAVIAITFFVLPLLPLGQNPQFQRLPGKEPLLYWFYLSNLGNIFGSGGKNDALGVTWSLAIEEQFYMVWPLIIFFAQPQTVKRICLALLGGSLFVRIIMLMMNLHNQHDVIYECTPCRFDAIAIGSFLAVIVREQGIVGIRQTLIPKVPWIAAASGLVILGVCAWHRSTAWDGAPGQAFGYTFVAIFFSCVFLVALTSTPGQWIHWFFTRSWMRFFGKYSYALYLVHLPMRRIVQDYVYHESQFLTIRGSRIPGELIFTAICSVASIAAALLSWNLLEKHCLKLKRYFPTHQAIQPAELQPIPTAAELLQDQQVAA